MQIASTKSGESLQQLASRVYSFKGEPTKAKLRAATTALAEANPFLRTSADIPAQTHVIVPPLKDAEPGAETEPVDAVTIRVLLQGLGSLVEQTADSLLDAVDRDVEDTHDSISLLRSGRVKRAAAEAGLADDLQDATKAATNRTADAEELRRQHKRVVQQIAEDLAEMRSALGA
jgi:hypothetical protein